MDHRRTVSLEANELVFILESHFLQSTLGTTAIAGRVPREGLYGLRIRPLHATELGTSYRYPVGIVHGISRITRTVWLEQAQLPNLVRLPPTYRYRNQAVRSAPPGETFRVFICYEYQCSAGGEQQEAEGGRTDE